MAQVTVVFTNDDVKRLILHELARLLPDTKVKPDCVLFETKAENEEKWEVAHVRFRYINFDF